MLITSLCSTKLHQNNRVVGKKYVSNCKLTNHQSTCLQDILDSLLDSLPDSLRRAGCFTSGRAQIRTRLFCSLFPFAGEDIVKTQQPLSQYHQLSYVLEQSLGFQNFCPIESCLRQDHTAATQSQHGSCHFYTIITILYTFKVLNNIIFDITGFLCLLIIYILTFEDMIEIIHHVRFGIQPLEPSHSDRAYFPHER